MAITAAQVKELREMTGAGMMECKKALTEAAADMEKAVDLLREWGVAKVAKRPAVPPTRARSWRSWLTTPSPAWSSS